MKKKLKRAPGIKYKLFCKYKGKECIHFGTELEARIFFELGKTSVHKDTSPVRYYLCECGCWHYSSKKKRNK